VLYRVEGGGHTWPGGKQYTSPVLVGTTNRDINATEQIWAFFAAHPMP
jgi:polyhydroxybutyrate depolymerase